MPRSDAYDAIFTPPAWVVLLFILNLNEWLSIKWSTLT